MTTVIRHAQFYGDSYIEIPKTLCTKNNKPFVSPLEENHDSNAIIEKLSEQCQEFQGKISSETESEISNSDDEESKYAIEIENEESPKEEDQFWKGEKRATTPMQHPTKKIIKIKLTIVLILIMAVLNTIKVLLANVQ